MTNEITETELERMTKYLLARAACSLTLGQAQECALSALELGAKLPDLRMERGRVAYEAFGASTCPWDQQLRHHQELWARAAEAARAAP